MATYPHLAARVFNVPLLVHPGKLDAIIAGLGERLLGVRLDDAAPASVGAVPAQLFSTRRGERSAGGYTVVDGVARISAMGVLMHRARFDAADSSYFLGYDALASALEAAMDDAEVHAVLQVFDSPGGEVAGAFEYGDRIHALRGRKPMWAVADSMAASAAYLAGSAFDQLAVGATGYAGSIGVVLRHVDLSHALASGGVRVTQIFAGEHKVDANQFEPLTRSVQAALQTEVDDIYAMLVDAVARNRGLDPQAVRDTQAATYRGQAAVVRGLADRVSTADTMLAELVAMRRRMYPAGQVAGSTATTKGASMSGTNPGGQQAAQPIESLAFTQLDLDAARAEGLAQGVVEGRAEGARLERERIQAVRAQSLPGHEALVESLAFDGCTTGPEAAAAVLAAERTARAAAIQDHRADAPAPAPVSAPVDGPLSKDQQVAAARAYAAEHKVDFVAALKALGFAA